MANRIVLLGIDGSGKSTMAEIIKDHCENKGYNVTIIPFHHWLFADKFRSVFGKMIDRGRKGRNTPYKPPAKSFAAFVKPIIAYIDNILFYKVNSPKKKEQIFIYDRFICATQIKFAALGYYNNWFKSFGGVLNLI